MPLFDLQKVGGTNFTVQDKTTGEEFIVKVIKAELLFEIMRAHQMQMEILGLVAEGVELVDLFEGFVQSPNDITWFTTTNHKLIPTKAVRQASKEGNRICVVELLPASYENEGFKPGSSPR